MKDWVRLRDRVRVGNEVFLIGESLGEASAELIRLNAWLAKATVYHKMAPMTLSCINCVFYNGISSTIKLNNKICIAIVC